MKEEKEREEASARRCLCPTDDEEEPQTWRDGEKTACLPYWLANAFAINAEQWDRNTAQKRGR